MRGSKHSDFRSHTINRTCDCQFEDYNQYRSYLEEDFQHRCCYCNMIDDLITPLSFHIDHFVPIAKFKGKRDSLKTCYDNLLYACPKCNMAKKDKFSGEISEDRIENLLFYNPVEVDYNTVFYRDKRGCILSDDMLGKQMMEILKLYRPVHQMAWIIEELNDTYNKIENQLEYEKDETKRELLQKAYDKLGHVLRRKERFFRVAYKKGFGDIVEQAEV